MNGRECRIAVLVGLIALCGFPVWALSPSAAKVQPKNHYPIAGLVIGTPSLGLNAVVGYAFGNLEARLSGGIGGAGASAAGVSWGVQADAGYQVTQTKNFEDQLELFGNYMNASGFASPGVAGAGVAVSILLFGVFADAGIGYNFLPNNLGSQGFGAGFNHLDVDLQVGYLYRFR